MPTTGFVLPTARTVEALPAVGTWANDGNILADDGLEAVYSLAVKSTTGRWLSGQTFGFDSLIPAGNQIDQVNIRMDYRVNTTGGIANPEMQAFVGGVAVGAVRAGSPAEPLTLTLNTFDITADRAWTRADLLDGTFELKVRGRNGNSATDPSYRWDYIAVEVVHSAPAAAFTRANTFDGGTNGVQVTAANSGGTSGDAFTDVVSSTSCTFTFDGTQPAHGTFGAKVLLGSTAGESYAYWTDSTARATYWYRVYLYWTANPGGIINVLRALNLTTLRGVIAVDTLGKVILRDANGTTQATSTNAIPLNAWFRLEGFIKGSATIGQIEMKLFDVMDSTTPLETVTSAATLNTGGTIDRTRVGHAGTAVANVTYWIDDVAVSSDGYIGPVASPAVTLPELTMAPMAAA